MCFGAFMGQLDASIVTLTYRPVQAEFHAGLAGVEWVSLAYLLVLIALVVPVGRLSDAHGRKLLYLYGFVVFTAGSAACGFAPSLGLLISFRAVQALGAAMLQANSVALVTTSTPPARRPQPGRDPGLHGGLAVGVSHQRSRRSDRRGQRLLSPAPHQRAQPGHRTGLVGSGVAGGRRQRLAARDIHRLGSVPCRPRSPSACSPCRFGPDGRS